MNLGDAADVRERAADKIQVVILDEAMEVKAGTPLLARSQGDAIGQAAEAGNILKERIDLHGVFDHVRMPMTKAAGTAHGRR